MGSARGSGEEWVRDLDETWVGCSRGRILTSEFELESVLEGA